MKLQRFLVFVLALFLTNTAFIQAQNPVNKSISVAEFEEIAKNKGATVIIDVRTPEEIEKGYLPRARNIDVSNENFENEISKLPKNKTYLLYCKAGVRSEKAMEMMKEAGFKYVFSLSGGIDAWKEAGKPVEK
ncbi:rhodanese-like domain-containing protein [Algoriphagus sp. AGSA1]|uniref:rhodanese-like domain-containing protein n=1 Tax=Algoriphagus sp. AGSA1 TaxID=2907213 RepID=UPI001F309ABB|nr:rhodanese-like domain-containing protein [Algoriphagus sp. AGSA1]MCE7057459.1 rhodanese-like domain-containing protein [Algoriphagus sp. AGSA1]